MKCGGWAGHYGRKQTESGWQSFNGLRSGMQRLNQAGDSITRRIPMAVSGIQRVDQFGPSRRNP